jgi:hypothetical protein
MQFQAEVPLAATLASAEIEIDFEAERNFLHFWENRQVLL